jgi:hypothetical protein
MVRRVFGKSAEQINSLVAVRKSGQWSNEGLGDTVERGNRSLKGCCRKAYQSVC